MNGLAYTAQQMTPTDRDPRAKGTTTLRMSQTPREDEEVKELMRRCATSPP
jgi:hypothetical protein